MLASSFFSVLSLALYLPSLTGSAPAKKQELQRYNIFVVTERHKASQGIDIPCGCSTEDLLEKDCITGTVLFYIEGKCYPYSRSDQEAVSSFRFWDSNATHAYLEVHDRVSDCRNDPKVNQDDGIQWEYGSCYDDDTYTFKRLENWCIKSRHAVAEYSVPMAEYIVSGSLNDCQLKGKYVRNLLPADNSMCFPRAVPVNDTVVQGSEIRTCHWEDGSLETQYFTGPDCQNNVQEPGALKPDNPVRMVESTCHEQSDSIFMAANCQDIQYFCKDFIAAGVGQRVHVSKQFKINAFFLSLAVAFCLTLFFVLMCCTKLTCAIYREKFQEQECQQRLVI